MRTGVAGFYGAPWTRQQRVELLGNMAEWGLQFYVYGPKVCACAAVVRCCLVCWFCCCFGCVAVSRC